MRRRGVQVRGVAGIMVCVMLAISAIVRESLDTRFFMDQYSAVLSPDGHVRSPSANLRDDLPEAIHFYGFRRNATAGVIPRVVILSSPDRFDTMTSFGTSPPKSHSQVYRAMLDLMSGNNPLSNTNDTSARDKRNKHASSLPFQFLHLEKAANVSFSNMNYRRMKIPEATKVDEGDIVYRRFEREWYEDCVPVTENSGRTSKSESTTTVQSVCNTFHELDLVEAYGPKSDDNDNDPEEKTIQQRENRIELLGEGNWRSVWKLFIRPIETPASPFLERNVTASDTADFGAPDLVLKLLHIHREFDENSFSVHQIDAVVMDALSASDYVVDSFGFCGQSVITEAAMSSGRALIKTKTLRWIDRLRIARDLARGLADLHALVAHPWEESSSKTDIDGDRPSSLSLPPFVFAHHDVNPANLIGVNNEKIRWNDFNLGLVNRRYAREDDSSNRKYSNECPVPVRYKQLLWRSPEECHNRTGTLFLEDVDETGRNTAAQAADVYSLGNILFYVLARHQPWSHLEEDEEPEPDDTNPDRNQTHTNRAIAKLKTGTTPENKLESLLAIGRAKVEGRLPNLPERYREKPGAKILWEAVQKCYTHDPEFRPRAHEIARFLETGHALLLREEEKKLHRNKQHYEEPTTASKSKTKSKDKAKDKTKIETNDKKKETIKNKIKDITKDKVNNKDNDKDKSNGESKDKTKYKNKDKANGKSEHKSKDRTKDKVKDKDGDEDKANEESKDKPKDKAKEKDKVKDSDKDNKNEKAEDKFKDETKDKEEVKKNEKDRENPEIKGQNKG